MSRRQSRRRASYGRRQHDVRERRIPNDYSSWLLEAPGSAGGSELGADRLRRPDQQPDSQAEAA